MLRLLNRSEGGNESELAAFLIRTFTVFCVKFFLRFTGESKSTGGPQRFFAVEKRRRPAMRIRQRKVSRLIRPSLR